MTTTQKLRSILLSTILVWLTSCDPSVHGDVKVFNETTYVLTIKFNKSNTDTATVDIQPNSNETIKILVGIGSNKSFDCCPCEAKPISIKSSLGQIKKDPNNQDNWLMPNKDKLKRYGGPDLKCEFHVTQADL